MDVDIDALVTGLVREFLFRRGLTSVLATFDAETGHAPDGGALSSTRGLVEALRLSTLYKRNAASGASKRAERRPGHGRRAHLRAPPPPQTRRCRACSRF